MDSCNALPGENRGSTRLGRSIGRRRLRPDGALRRVRLRWGACRRGLRGSGVSRTGSGGAGAGAAALRAGERAAAAGADRLRHWSFWPGRRRFRGESIEIGRHVEIGDVPGDFRIGGRLVRENFRSEQNQQNHHKVKRNRGESRDRVPGRRALLDRLGHQIDFAGGEDVRIEDVRQILNGDDLLRLDLGRVRILGHGHARIQDRQRHIVGRLADRIERRIRHVARDDDGVAKHFQLEIGRNRGVGIEFKLRQVRRHKRARIQVGTQSARRRVRGRHNRPGIFRN